MLTRLKRRYWEWARKEAVSNKAVADMRFSDLAESYILAEAYYEEKLGREIAQGDYVKPLPAKYIDLGASASGCERCQGDSDCGWCGEDRIANHIIGIKTEQQWLGNVSWHTDGTYFQAEALSGKYPDIQNELNSINDRAVFNV